MSGKHLNAHREENPDLHKQIGCMTGIFQMFDRRHLPARRLRKRLTSGDDVLPDCTEVNSIPSQVALEKNPSKNQKENQRMSNESSRPSFSSASCSSSFSSFEGSKSTQQESSMFEQTTFMERSLKNPPTLQASEIDSKFLPSSPCQYSKKLSTTSGQAIDFRDVVKDSINRESRSSSIKTTNKEESKKHVMKHKDSPMPFPLSKATDRTNFMSKGEKQNMHRDLDKSIRVLAKLKETPGSLSKNRSLKSYEMKDGSFFTVAREAPRFSCDGKEISCSTIDSMERSKCSTRMRELPRLSLDSRRSSMYSNLVAKSNSLMKDIQNTTYRPLTLQQAMDTPRQTSVVAKLMGLEAMPSESGMQIQTHLSEICTINNNQTLDNLEAISPSLKLVKAPEELNEKKHNCSPRGSNKDSVCPQPRPADLVRKSVPNSRMTVEAAPWKQSRSQNKKQNTALKSGRGRIQQQHETVFSEIGKKLKELDLQKTNKNLTALKQILDAIKSKGSSETKTREILSSKFLYKKKDHAQGDNGTSQSPRTANIQQTSNSRLQTRLTKESTTSRPLEDPIVIMKPARSVNKMNIPASSVVPLYGFSSLHKVHTSDNTDIERNAATHGLHEEDTAMLALKAPALRILLSTTENSNKHKKETSSCRTCVSMGQVSPRLQQAMKDNNGSMVRTSGSSSPRQQQKRHELEKKSRSPVPSSETAKSKKQSTVKHISDSVSPLNRSQQRLEQVHHRRSKSSEINIDNASLSNHIDEDSPVTESNIRLASQLDLEVTSSDRSVELASIQHHRRTSNCAVNDHSSMNKEKNSLKDFGEDASGEPSVVGVDQPSPISVLDASFYSDDLPISPVSRISHSCRGDDAQDSNDHGGVTWKTAGPDNHLPNNPVCGLSSRMCHQKLDSIENLLQKLRELSSSKGKESPDVTGHSLSECEMNSQDHRYISEVLLASGLLDTTTCSPAPKWPHRCGYAMDSGVFHVLEQTHLLTVASQSTCGLEKLHRRLIFDTVNVILTQKLQSAGGCARNGGKRRMPMGQELLKEVSLEIERLQALGRASEGVDDDADGLTPVLSEDMARQSEEWKKFGKEEVAGLVLDMERSIFRDLIGEVVNGEAAAFVLASDPSGRRRQLLR